ncbi:MAG: hypothetical protein U5R31_03590 [Acidimicrobiia bacterium]|nr:hypothetical protein [Acidimicrobiia bacterium]
MTATTRSGAPSATVPEGTGSRGTRALRRPRLLAERGAARPPRTRAESRPRPGAGRLGAPHVRARAPGDPQVRRLLR